MQPSTLENVALLEKYREARQHIFPSDNALHWYFRNHKQGLIECGALLLIRGKWHADFPLFDQYVRVEGSRRFGGGVLPAP